MPKIVDHEQRRDEIALIACRVVARHGFEQATIVRIARAAGCTTGMIAHYFDTKQEIIVAALRLILRRIEARLSQAGSAADLLTLLSEALPLDQTRYMECAVWMAFWGQVPADKRLKRINAWLHREYLRLFERCLARSFREWHKWPAATRDQLLRSSHLHQRCHGEHRGESRRVAGHTPDRTVAAAAGSAVRVGERRRRHCDSARPSPGARLSLPARSDRWILPSPTSSS